MPAHHIRFLLARRPALVAIARNRVTSQVRAWGTVLDPDAQDTLDLLVSELVTNSVLHAHGLLITVGVHLERGRLRVEVDDDSAQPPIKAPSGPLEGWEEESGRGGWLIATLAAKHGWEPTHGGKRVWFELAVPEPSRTRARAALMQQTARALRSVRTGSVIRPGCAADPSRPRRDPVTAATSRITGRTPALSLTCENRIGRMPVPRGPLAA
jgi:anti-sigma regulatory factor (Ser/Thr protein kinase)